ncbi:MAG: nucleotide exchange factor GrpE [Candidatus Azambacteria bacterium]|nr:nucleotide exchange factor GrpE [Candidatus Azambacteria bacterium]
MNEENNVEVLKKQAQEYLDGWKRAKADYLNLKKEMEAQNREIKEWMSKIMLLPLLSILYGFDKAFDEIPENLKNNLWVNGINGVKKQFEDYLKTQGVEVIKTKGEKFDPMKHEAVESADGGESGVIVEEFQKGYLIKGEVLRPAKVKVYK